VLDNQAIIHKHRLSLSQFIEVALVVYQYIIVLGSVCYVGIVVKDRRSVLYTVGLQQGFIPESLSSLVLSLAMQNITLHYH
jgi:hypothetical protein